jgi:hypothetical protein
MPQMAQAAVPTAGLPTPIPGGFDLFGNSYHIFTPPPVKNGTGDPIAINDFKGVVALADITGQGKDGAGTTLDFGADLRIMKGVFADSSGRHHDGAFAFV